MSGDKDKKTVDARGKSCPEPVVLTRKALDSYPGQEVEVIIDSPVARENVTRMARKQGNKVEVEEREGEFYLKIIK